MSTYTIVQWTAIIAAIAGYIYYSKYHQKSPLAAQRVAAAASNKLDQFLDESSGTDKKRKAKTPAVKKKKPTATTKAANAVKEIIPQAVLDTVNSKFSDVSAEEEDDSLQRLAGLNTGKGKEEKKTEKKKDKKKNTPAATKIADVTSSTSSTTGADADIDENTEEETLISSSINPTSDMLEETSGASVLRITPSNDPFTVVGKKNKPASTKKESLTQKQRQNAKKNEDKREFKELEQKERLAALEKHKKSQRLAREAEVSRTTKKAPDAPSGVWETTSGPSASVRNQLLDTFESSSKNPPTPPSSSDVDSHSQFGEESQLTREQIKDIPADVLAEYYPDRQTAPQSSDSGWIEVKKAKKGKAVSDAGTDSDNMTPKPDVTPAPVSSSNSTRSSAPAAKAPGSFADIKVPKMPAMKDDGWAAHGW